MTYAHASWAGEKSLSALNRDDSRQISAIFGNDLLIY